MIKIRAALEAAAANCGDLISSAPNAPKPADRYRHKMANVTKTHSSKMPMPPLADSSDESDFDSETGSEGMDSLKKIVKAAVSVAMAVKAHPSNGKFKRNAEGSKLTQGQLDKLKQEVCANFQLGACRWGDSCRRKHVLLSKPEAVKLAAVVKERNESMEDGYCYAFKANGACSFGDNWKFSHENMAKKVQVRKHKKHVAYSARAPSTLKLQQYNRVGEPALPGELVVLGQDCNVPALRGAVGQAHIQIKDRTCVQLVISNEHSALGSEAVQQWVHMANTVGMLQTQYVICPPAERHIVLAANDSRAKYAPRGNGPYSLNAIFDTGSLTHFCPATGVCLQTLRS